MPFEKGKSGNPGGRGKAKPISDMYRRIIADERRLKRYCMSVYRAAIQGDMVAAKEIADRLEGKPLQSIDVTDTRTDSASRLAELLASAVTADSAKHESGRPN